MQELEEEIMTGEDVMKILKMQRTTFQKLNESKVAPPWFKVGAKRFITKESFLKWLKAHEGEDHRYED